MASLLSRVNLFRSSTSKGIWAAAQTCRRCLTSSEKGKYVSVTIDPDFEGSVAVVTLKKKPVNAFCSEQLLGITKAITDLENDEQVRAMIVTSAYPGVFSAGLDIMSMYQKTEEEIYTYWCDIQEMIGTNLNSSLITIAAMNGHCIAGGCSLTFGTDYRIIADDHLVGLHEAKLGMPIPFYMSTMTKNLTGTRQAEEMFQLARLLKSEEALKLGLVDEVVPMDEVMAAAKKQVVKWLEIPDKGRIRVKRHFRKDELKDFHENKDSEARLYANLNSSPEMQTTLKQNLDSLRNKQRT